MQEESNCPVPQIHNIVSTSQIKSDRLIELSVLADMLPFSFYDKRRFAAITIRLQNPNCTTLLFSSGKLVVTGSRNHYECILASLHVCRILRDAFPSRSFVLVNCENQNMVGHVEIPLKEGESLDLRSMYEKLGVFCMYQPTLFPGLVYRPHESPVVLLAFFSGKIVVTGARSTVDVYEGWRRLWPTVRVFVRRMP
jgi:transcription initiation factor TFIID TATA-box-binding protein